MLQLRGWTVGPWARRTRRAKTAFYSELGDLVREWHGAGKSVVVGGDFNDPLTPGSQLREWAGALNLTDAYTTLKQSHQAEGDTCTYSSGSMGSRIDHLLVSGHLHSDWFSSATTMRTARPAEDPIDHRALTLKGMDWRGWTIAGRLSAQHHRDIQAAQLLNDQERPPPRVEAANEEAYQAMVLLELREPDLEDELSALEHLGGWGVDLWRCKGGEGAERLKVGWQGQLVHEVDWHHHEATHGADVQAVGTPDAQGQTAWWSDWRQAWGRWADEVVDQAEGAATRAEAIVCNALVTGAHNIAPSRAKGGGTPPPRRSRRRRNGWFPGIGQFRRALALVHRMMSCCRTRGRKRIVQLIHRARSNPHLRTWARVDHPQGWSRAHWRVVARRLWRLRESLGREMHGKARSTRRCNISKAVEKRERAFKEGHFRRVLDSVLHRRRGGAPLQVVEDEEGNTHTSPQGVAQTAHDYFDGVFAGAGGQTWFMEAGVGEGVRTYFADTPAGRRAREDGLRGKFHADWSRLPQWCQNLKHMVAFKGPVEELELRQEAFGDLLGPITQQEWDQEWGRKSRYTSGGNTGVRPDMVKGGGAVVHALLRRLYSACLASGTVPDQWRHAIIVAIEKVAGVTRVDKLRPLKLLEVTMKAVVSIVKDRVKRVVEELGLLHPWQMAFRALRYCALPAMGIVAAAEDAMRYKKDLHVVLLDIRKAYDSVIRTVGKGAALRRLGVPLRVVEFLMELDRRNKNTVRTFWSAFTADSVAAFEALRGFPQGSADAPLLWIIFYDMVLTELERRGVGQEVRIDIGRACSRAGGVGAFADDTAVMAETIPQLQRALEILHDVLRVVLLRLAPEKCYHMSMCFDRSARGEGGLLLEEDLISRNQPHRVHIDHVVVPRLEADVGARYLGYWLDLAGDGGDQVAVISRTIDEFTSSVKPACIGTKTLLYLLNHVLAPRVLYPLAVSAVGEADIRGLESKVLAWALKKLGLHYSFPRKLLASPISAGGLGWEPWVHRVTRERIHLAQDLCYHPDPRVRMIWDGMRLRWYQQSLSGRTGLGGARPHQTQTAEAGGGGGGPPPFYPEIVAGAV